MSKKAKLMQMRQKTKLIFGMIIIVIAALAVGFYSSAWLSLPPVNGLMMDAGIVKPDGTIIRLYPSLSVFTVNTVPVNPTDYFYFRPVLNLQPTGVSGTLTGVRFKYENKWTFSDGTTYNWYVGTEGVVDITRVPPTSPTESWFQMALTVANPPTTYTVPLKFRDASWGGSLEPLPLSVYEPTYTWTGGTTTGDAIRQAALHAASEIAAKPDGTTTLTCTITVVAVTWQWHELGVAKTGTIVPSPATLSYTFTITKSTAGLTATLTQSP